MELRRLLQVMWTQEEFRFRVNLFLAIIHYCDLVCVCVARSGERVSEWEQVSCPWS